MYKRGKNIQERGICLAHFESRDIKPNVTGKKSRLVEHAVPRLYSADENYKKLREEIAEEDKKKEETESENQENAETREKLVQFEQELVEEMQPRFNHNKDGRSIKVGRRTLKNASVEERRSKAQLIHALNEKILIEKKLQEKLVEQEMQTDYYKSKYSLSVQRERTAQEHLVKEQEEKAKLRNRCEYLTVRAEQLKKQIVEHKEKLKILKLEFTSRSNKKKSLEEFYKDHKLENYMKRALVSMILRDPKKKETYTMFERMVAQQLMYYSQSGYNFFRKEGDNFLPHPATVRRWIAETKLGPGINDHIFEGLKERIKNLPPEERVVGVKFDEMTIRAHEEYNKFFDVVEGLVDMGGGKRRPETAKHVLVFCIDSLHAENPWHQFLTYQLSGKGGASAEELKDALDDILPRLQAAGADVRLITCDQGASNRRLFREYLKICNDKTKEWTPTYFCEKTQKSYFTSFDFPHLIKRLIYALRTHHRIYNRKKEVIVDYKDLLNVYAMDYGNGVSEALTHLSWTHFLPNNFQCMNVRRAFQVLGGRLARTMQFVHNEPSIKIDRTTMQESIDFVNKMNDIVDICNSTSDKSKTKWKLPLSLERPESLQKLRDMIGEIKGWYTLTKKGNFSKPPCFHGLIITLKCFLGLAEDLSKLKGFKLATRYCNQDSVENFFSKIRQRGGNNPSPTARGCRLIIRHILATKHIRASVNGNAVLCDTVRNLQDSVIPSNQRAANSEASSSDTPVDKDKDVPSVSAEEREQGRSAVEEMLAEPTPEVPSADAEFMEGYDWDDDEFDEQNPPEIDDNNFEFPYTTPEFPTSNECTDCSGCHEGITFPLNDEEIFRQSSEDAVLDIPLEEDCVVDLHEFEFRAGEQLPEKLIGLDKEDSDIHVPLPGDKLAPEEPRERMPWDSYKVPAGQSKEVLYEMSANLLDTGMFLHINTTGELEHGSVAYFSGAAVSRMRKVKNFCQHCLKLMVQSSKDLEERKNRVNQPQMGLIEQREYEDKDSDKKTTERLQRPSDEFAHLAHVALLLYRDNWAKVYHLENPIATLMGMARAHEDLHRLWFDCEEKCLESRKVLIRYLYRVKMFRTTRVRNEKKKLFEGKGRSASGEDKYTQFARKMANIIN